MSQCAGQCNCRPSFAVKKCPLPLFSITLLIKTNTYLLCGHTCSIQMAGTAKNRKTDSDQEVSAVSILLKDSQAI
jgi:hypothetical protein